MEQLLAHLVGDYVLQTSHMAEHKIRSWPVAAVHAITYCLPFLFITLSLPALAVIGGTHAVIDRYRLDALASQAGGSPEGSPRRAFEHTDVSPGIEGVGVLGGESQDMRV